MNINLDSYQEVITIGLPVFNGCETISHALDSLLNQTYQKFIILISDNASTDGTEEICRKYEKKDSRIRYYRHSVNIGMHENFKWVFEKSTSPYFCWMADDDTRSPTFLASMLSLLEDFPFASAACAGWRVFNSEDNTPIRNASTAGSFQFKSSFVRSILRVRNPAPILMYGVFRRQLLEKVLISRFDYWDLYLIQYMEALGPIMVSPDPLVGVGVRGKVRNIYSVTGKSLTTREYNRCCDQLYFEHFTLFKFLLLSVISRASIFFINRANNLRKMDSTKADTAKSSKTL